MRKMDTSREVGGFEDKTPSTQDLGDRLKCFCTRLITQVTNTFNLKVGKLDVLLNAKFDKVDANSQSETRITKTSKSSSKL